MKTRMNFSILFLILFIVGMMGPAGCTNETKEPPVIKNLVYMLHKVPAEEGKTANVAGTFDITSIGAETASVNAIVYDSQGKQISSNSTPLTDAALRTFRQMGFLVEISIAQKGTYTFHVYIVDAKGAQSNHLIGTLDVTDVF